jgi:multidrug resistance efflux pump
MATRTEPAPSANGELIDRVQQLRLTPQLGAGRATGGGRGSWLPWVLCGMMAVVWAGVGVRSYKLSGGKAEAPAGSAPAAAAPAATQAQPGVPQPAAGELVIQIKGIVIPSLQINLSPDDVSGIVERIHFKEGDQVRQGQLLAEIRPNRYRNDAAAAKAALTAAENRLADLGSEAVRAEERRQAEAERDEAEAARVRADLEVKRLTGQRAVAVVSTQDVERAEADLRSAKARVERLSAALNLLNMGARQQKVDAAKAEVAQAKARHEEAERLLKNCEVTAPIDGTILTKSADRGTLVSPMSLKVETGICSMADLSQLEVELDIPERQVERVRPGQDCLIQADADPSRPYRGVVDRKQPVADDTKNVVKVRVRVYLPKGEVPGVFLKPKMSVVATVYNREFAPDPAKDAPWGDEKK